MNIEKHTKIKKFIASRELFTWAEFSAFLTGIGSTNIGTQRQILRNQIKAKRITIIRQGLYLRVGDAFEPEEVVPDPYLVSGKVANDAVVAYHSALEYYGTAYSVFFQSTFLTHKLIRPFFYKDHDYISTRFPAALLRKNQEYFLCDTVTRSGVTFKVTSIERTFVDVLDRPNISGGIEEVIRSIETLNGLNIENIIDYALLLENETTVARVGYMLECLQEYLHFDDDALLRLEKKCPKNANYFDDVGKKKRGGTLLKRWNLIVSDDVFKRTWEEF